ncbi:sulfatase-like hydrolase/transferase [Spiroplasma platyhelix]|uniref:Sulfatase-like hydrolase/transferase n=1 Tax=Spiroplasma platyhelix PALS-1 TaxID=1276218 RepID=A0A846U2J1_9MOLU|nr:sulfatase-like hydrolase/transferase [Spiroplasma platyhelix]MBE4704367.1 hypothetical protein [Spiroplasma platyhelix PALS-1]NKE38739.1 sulfatase-like hydrolase/transferase [Spiroplasma platyhelix PALS-1]UJB28950.1 hypothetical protein SPLAT_v1c01850 [Spiroplasma platyhelix PALS-1]
MKKSWNLILIPFFIFLIILTIIIIAVSTIFSPYRYPFNTFAKVEATMTLSKNKKNVVYIMIDMTTGFDVTSILQSNPEMANNFSGFTNYLNVISTNWGTNASVPNIFGGYDFNPYYKNHGPAEIESIKFKDYMKNAMNILISAFGQSNWDLSAIGNQYYNYNSNKSYWDSNWETLESDFKEYNLKAINSNDVTRLLYYQYPNLYKKINLPNQFFLKSSNANFISISEYLSHCKIQDTENNKFMTIMNESNHSPTVMDQFGNYQTSNVTIENIYKSTTGFVTKINNFISYLKANNIYDNTMIVINSDHGNNGTGSLPIANSAYNHTGIDYQDIVTIEKKYPSFTRAFPVLLVKPFSKTTAIEYDNNYLYTNTDILSFIKEYNNDVIFNLLDQTKDPRFLKQLSDIQARSNVYMPSYHNDSLWSDDFNHYLNPDSGFGGVSFLVKQSIYQLANYLVAKDLKDYYSPDALENWNQLTI